MHNTPITLRKAAMSDLELLLAWRNDPEARRYSHHTDVVTRDTQETWLKCVLLHPERKLYIALDHTQTPVGMVRADWMDSAWQLSWTVASEARGKGLGKALVGELIRQLEGPCRAEVKVENIASAKIAEAVGMRLECEDNGVLHYAFP